MVFHYRSFHDTNFGTQRVLCVLWYFTIVHSTTQTSARNACSFLYPFQRLRMRKLNGIVLWYFAVARSAAQTSARNACSFLYPFQRLRKRKLNGYKKTECIHCMHSAKFVVGVTGLEPMASWPPVKRATKLRHTPIYIISTSLYIASSSRFLL